MITIHNWMATIPPEEACIAYVGEDEAVWREFLLTGERWERYMAWAFYLDMAFDPSGMPAPVEGEESVEALPATDIAALEKSATPEGIALRWTVRRQQTRIPGRLRANLRALGPAGQVKKSATMLFEVQPSVSATPAAEVPVSAFEEMEQRMGVLADEARQAADEAAEARSEAASVARSAQEAAADADKSAVTAVNAAVSAIDNAKVASQANTAAGNSASRANAAAIAAEAARLETQTAAEAVAGAYIHSRVTGTAVRLAACVAGSRGTVQVSGVDNPAAVTVKQYGKNLLPYPYYTNKTTVNGLTFAVGEDGSIRINGTATAFTSYQLAETAAPLVLPLGATITVSGGVSPDVYINIKSTDGEQVLTDNGTGRTVVAQRTAYRVQLCIRAGITVDNVVVYPQVELGGVQTPFSPYMPPVALTPEADGTVAGVTLTADTTLMTDTAGAVLTAEYVKDATTVVAELLERIAALEAAVLAE